MTNHFTSPEFYTETLKPFGIEVDTPFYRHEDFKGVFITNGNPNGGYNTYVNIETKEEFGLHYTQISPAYLLSQVLGWLPKRFKIGNLNCEMSCVINKGNVFLSYYGKNEDATHEKCTSSMDIEWYVTQGLTEGWLTKEIIEQAIKDNQ